MFPGEILRSPERAVRVNLVPCQAACSVQLRLFDHRPLPSSPAGAGTLFSGVFLGHPTRPRCDLGDAARWRGGRAWR